MTGGETYEKDKMLTYGRVDKFNGVHGVFTGADVI
jgi:hypothetical protein